MRTCMYCGRELGAGEQCGCYQSEARRRAKEENQNAKTGGDAYETSYKTGYAGKESWFERAENRRRARKAARHKTGGGFFKELFGYMASAVKNSVEAVVNPKSIGLGAMLIIAAIAGALMWLCMFFVLRGGTVGPLRLIAAAMGIGGGYRLLAMIGLSLVSGAVGGIVVFFVYTGIFYLINRFVMRMRTGYTSLCERLIGAWIPFTVMCLAGTVFGMFSVITLIAMVICGAIAVAALTFEALRTEWYDRPPSMVLLGMVLGYFVFFTFMGHLLLIR